MERLLYDTKYSKIMVYSEFSGFKEDIQPYLYSYANIKENCDNETDIDARVYIFKTDIKDCNRDIRINEQKNEIGVTINEWNRDNQLYIKRLLINLNNRVLESKGVVFIHASLVCYGNEGIMFIGDRGNGKTTNMIYMLEHEGMSYVSNDRTGLKLDEKTGEIIMMGIPSSINIRPGTIEQNRTLKNKLSKILAQKGYNDALKYREATSMKSRMTFSIQELKDNLEIEEKDVCRLRMYCTFRI